MKLNHQCLPQFKFILGDTMANLKEIRDRIVSVKNTRKITEAMRLVAAAKVRRAQDQVLKSRPLQINLRES